jgi:catechol 2,3-dioxygenase-like lactoylglutathione lyase family enzyme
MTGLVPTLMVEDVLRSVAFYHEVLGFAFVRGLAEGTRTEVVGAPSSPLAWAQVANGEARLAFATRSCLSAAAPRLVNMKLGGALVLDLECDDLTAVCETLRRTCAVFTGHAPDGHRPAPVQHRGPGRLYSHL